MIEDKGIIIKIDKEEGIGIKIEGLESCDTCAVKSNCAQKRGEILNIPYVEGFDVGDRVKIKITTISLINASIFIYLFPLIIFISAILVSYFILFTKSEEILRALYSFVLSC